MAQLQNLLVLGDSRFLNEINGKIDWSNILNKPTIGTGSVTSVAASGTGGISVSGSPITTSGTLSIGVNGSTVINNLTTGDSNAQRTDYIVAQYAGGGTTTTTYHRRPLSKIFAALNKSDITTALGYTPPTSDTNTHRPIQMNDTEILGNNTTALNLKAGTNVSLSHSSGTVTIAATDTTYSSKAAASDGTDVSLVTTGEKYIWNNKGNGTVTQVKVGTTAYNPSSGIISLPAYPSVPVSSVAGKTGAVTLTSSDVGLGNVGNFKAVSTVASQGLTATEQSNARANIGAGTSNLTLGTTSTTALKGDTKYAGASTAGGAATSAAKLTNTAKIGDTNKPVYFTASGVPSAISYTIAKSVPSDAVFTDTTYTIATGDANGQIKVTPTGGTAYNVSVKGLGSNAFTSTAYLPLAGGTTSGDIVVANSNSVSFVSVKSMDATIDTTTNNSITANTNTGNFLFRGKDDAVVGRINQYLNTNGDSIVGLQAYNKMTNGTDFYNIFNITARKDGTATYNVTSPENFRAAIGVPYTLDSVDLATDKNLSSGTTLSNLHSFTLQKGLWYINCAVGFAANASGRRYIALSTDGSTAMGFIYVDTRVPVNGIITWCQISAPIYVSEATTIYVIGYQNSGSTLGTKVRVNRLRLSAYDS